MAGNIATAIRAAKSAMLDYGMRGPFHIKVSFDDWVDLLGELKRAEFRPEMVIEQLVDSRRARYVTIDDVTVSWD